MYCSAGIFRDKAFAAFLVVLSLNSFAQKPQGIDRHVDHYARKGQLVPFPDLFVDLQWSTGQTRKGELARMHLNGLLLNRLLTEALPAMVLPLPVGKELLPCELVRINLLSPDFRLVTASGKQVPYSGGLYYIGRIQGMQHSAVALSVFSGEVIALIAPESGTTLTLARPAGSGHYVLYREQELFPIPDQAYCHVSDSAAPPPAVSSASTRTVNCVRLHYELGYEIFQKCSSDVIATANWMTALHNNLAMVFVNDEIQTAISQIFVWDIPDPYNAVYSFGQLNLFKEYRPQLHGDLGQLLTIEPGYLGGVASTINGFCSLKNKYCYSDVEFEYEAYPVYSWTTLVLLHEFGHLMGSFHTHACNWDSGALDNCGPMAGFPNEGNCPEGPTPLNGGTIMSFCHLTPYGVNLAQGFGSQPAALIRSSIDAAACLTTNCAPIIPEYCPSVGNTKEEWIQLVQLGNVYNNSGPGGGYSDFTSQTIYAPPGQPLSYTFAPGYAKALWEENFSVFIDFNGDKDFFDSGERVLDILEVTVPVSGTIAIPTTASGETRLRLSMQFEEISEPCDFFNYGEVEDYTISFSAPVSYCSSYATDANQTHIDFFGWNNVTRHSGSDGGYHLEEDQVVDVLLGAETTVLYSCASTNKTMKYWKLWLDFNRDGDFEDEGEKIFGRKSKSEGYLVRKFTVPATVMPGKTRARLSVKAGSSPQSCEVFAEGEVEDYTVNLVPQQPAAVQQSLPSFRLFPNPATDHVTLETDAAVLPSAISVYDLTGRKWLLVRWNAEEPLLRLTVNHLPRGYYFVLRTCADGNRHLVPLLLR